MALSPDMSGNDTGPEFPSSGAIQDIRNHEEMNLPGDYSPAMKHSTKMAGDVIPFPIPMSQSDTNRNISSTAPDYSKTDKDWRGNPRPAKILRGPGSN